MHRLTLLAGFLLAAGTVAQSPLTTLTGGTNQGNVGNNIYFDLQINTTVTITQIVFRCGANTVASAAGQLQLYLGPSTFVGATDPAFSALWTPVATVTGITVNPSTTSTAIMPPGICLAPGNYGVALRSTAFNHGYTNGVTCTSTTLPGMCANSLFTRTEMVLRAGANQNFPWGAGGQSAALNNQRIFNGEIHYTPGGTPIAVAAWEASGKGCYGFYHSFRELYNNPSTSFDLENTGGLTNTLPLAFIGTGYAVGPFQTGTGTFYTPTAAATPLALTNDTAVTITTPFPVLYPMPGGPQASTSLIVCDNGFISPAATNGTGGAGATAAFFSGNPRWAPCWCNHDPTTGGVINFEVDPSGTKFYITWVAVMDFLNNGNAPGPNTFQIMFDNQGNVEYRYRAVSVAHGGTYPALVGWTTGGGALDAGDIDISQIAAPFITGAIDQHPLTLGLSQRPLLGSTPVFSISNMEPAQVVGGLMLNFADGPHTEMLAFGMPNCFQHVANLGAITTLFIGNPGAVNFSIPNATAFNGVLLYGQALGLGAVENSAFGIGINASNGVRLTLGNL